MANGPIKFEDSMKLLELAMEDLATKFSTRDIELTKHPSGIITLDVNGEAKECFFNGIELIDWLRDNYEKEL